LRRWLGRGDGLDRLANDSLWHLAAGFARQQIVQRGNRRRIAKLPERFNSSPPHFGCTIKKRCDQMSSCDSAACRTQLARGGSSLGRRIRCSQVTRGFIEVSMVEKCLARTFPLFRVLTSHRCE
jgi:hypothetical protein